MALIPYPALLLVLAGSLLAGEAAPAGNRPVPSQEPGAPLATVAFGGYNQSVSAGNGTWQGLLLDTSWDPWKDGKFVASLISFERSMGNGVLASVGKYQEFKGGFAFLGVGSSQGADYLPSIQIVSDLNLELPLPGLVLGAGLNFTRVRDGHRDLQISLGPTLYAGAFISTLRVARNRSFPGNHDSTSSSIQVRHGAQDHRAWQALRFSWGGEAYESLAVREAVQAHGAGVGLDVFQPVAGDWTVKAGVEWGQKYGAYHLWGGSLRVGRSF